MPIRIACLVSVLLFLFGGVSAGPGQDGATAFDLHDFGGTIQSGSGASIPDGFSPECPVAFDSTGNQYGTAAYGGANGVGIVWERTTSGAYVDLHDFGAPTTYSNGVRASDGQDPIGLAQGVSVTLSSSDPASASVPASVAVGQGQLTATFPITTGIVSSAATVIISATYLGVTRTTGFKGQPPNLLSVTRTPSSLVAGATATGTVGIATPATSGGITFPIASDSSFAQVAGSVTIPAGQVSGTFSITTSPVATNSVAMISGTLGTKTKSAKLTVLAPLLHCLGVAGSIHLSQSPIGTVVLSSPAPSGLQVTLQLSVSNSNATIPATATFAAGQTQATFVFTGTTAPTGGTPASVTASLNGVPKTVNFEIYP